jgi:Pyruvate/2-oxoacid:ferredoxin oxidoreductase delta subunit
MKVTRKIIKIDEELCDGCGQCVPSCAEGAIEILDGKARLVAQKYCDGLGACLGECPKGALTVVEREAEEFDEEAVEEYLSSKAQQESPEEATMACGCPSAHIQSFVPPASCQEANEPAVQTSAVSALCHWPVQIRLVPANAPFLKGADLLVAADCTPVAYPNFHQDFLKGKVVMVGCPKFDDIQDYIQKFADIFSAADVKSVTVVVMEVPCCQGLPVIVEKGMEMADKKIPMQKVVISARGEVLGREKLAA